MTYQNNEFENSQNQFISALIELQLSKLLRKSNVIKPFGVSTFASCVSGKEFIPFLELQT